MTISFNAMTIQEYTETKSLGTSSAATSVRFTKGILLKNPSQWLPNTHFCPFSGMRKGEYYSRARGKDHLPAQGGIKPLSISNENPLYNNGA